MEARHKTLLAMARKYAGSRQSEPGIAGIVLYGSLTSGDPPELTPFSDVDMALILDRELPAHFIEHRLADGIKLDVIFLQIDALRDLVARKPERLYQGGWLLQFLIKSFLQGNEDAILFDRTGEIARTRQKLKELTTYRQMVLPDARRWLEAAEKEYLTAAGERLRQGDFKGAMEKCGGVWWMLGDIARTLASTKNLEVAADRLGIPGFYATATELRQMFAPTASSIQAYRLAAHSLWDYTLHHIFESIRAELVQAGAEQPDKLELTGDYPLFWPGNRIHEFGRVIAEVNLSFAWSRFEQERGNLPEALSMLWACGSDRATRRCEGLAAALKDAGYNVSHIVTPCLEDPEFRRLAAEVDQAGKETQLRSASSAEAERAIQLAQELRETMAQKVNG
jgi:predicted nucleotidyltransferase